MIDRFVAELNIHVDDVFIIAHFFKPKLFCNFKFIINEIQQKLER